MIDTMDLLRSQRWIWKQAEEAGWLVNLFGDGRLELGDPDSGAILFVQVGDETTARHDEHGLEITRTRDVELTIEHRGASRAELEVMFVMHRGDDVRDWPDDEAAAYRDHGAFSAGRAAVARLRAQKIIAIVEATR